MEFLAARFFFLGDWAGWEKGNELLFFGGRVGKSEIVQRGRLDDAVFEHKEEKRLWNDVYHFVIVKC